jgi:hypothetical protein
MGAHGQFVIFKRMGLRSSTLTHMHACPHTYTYHHPRPQPPLPRVCLWCCCPALGPVCPPPSSLILTLMQAHAGSYDLPAVALALQDIARLGFSVSDEARESVVTAIVYVWRSKAETRDGLIK